MACVSAVLDPQPGGVFRFEVAEGEFCSGRYFEVDGGTLLRLMHTQIPAIFGDLHEDGWRQVLAGLSAVLEGRALGLHPARERPQEAIARLARERYEE